MWETMGGTFLRGEVGVRGESEGREEKIRGEIGSV